MKRVGDGSQAAAIAWLSRTIEPGNRDLWAYVAALGPVEVAAQLHAGDGPSRLQSAAGERWSEDRSIADLEAAARCGARLVTPGHPEWPDEVADLMGAAVTAGALQCVPPIGLWVRGPLSLATSLPRSIALVGARAATGYGEFVAADLAAGLVERGVTVVSGGAYGIDGAAHRAALGAGGDTIAVLACGIDRVYPSGNAQLLEQVARDGALVSEWPPGASAMRSRFLVRNRLIAGFTLGTVVVEAALRSGARSTAGRAREVGRVVMTVPGPVTSSSSAGCLQMLRDEGAVAVGSAAHVLEAVALPGLDLAPQERGADRPRDELDPSLQMLLDAVPVRRSAAAETIARAAAIVAADALRGLTILELMGYVEQQEGRWRLVTSTS